MNVLMDLAKKVESEMNLALGFDMDQAQAWRIQFDEGLNLNKSFVDASPDVYELLASEEVRDAAREAMAMAIFTTGWAAPLDPDGEVSGPPSQHEERRRVRLAIVTSQGSVISVIRFQDDDNDDNVIFDEDTATGTLADAIRLSLHG